METRMLEELLEERPEGAEESWPARPVLCCATRTIRSGDMTEVEVYPVYRWEAARRAKRMKPTGEAMRRVNVRRAQMHFHRMVACNFVPGRDYALSLTYEGDAPEDEATCRRHLTNYLARVNRARKRLGLDRARCIGVIELGRHGRLHHHLLIECGLDRDEMERLWHHGYANCDRIQKRKGGLTAITRYMAKGFEGRTDKGRHKYFYTKNIKKPKVTVSRSRISRRQAERIAEDADIYGAEILAKKYPGLQIEELMIRQTDWMPGAYIYARMRA